MRTHWNLVFNLCQLIETLENFYIAQQVLVVKTVFKTYKRFLWILTSWNASICTASLCIKDWDLTQAGKQRSQTGLNVIRTSISVFCRMVNNREGALKILCNNKSIAIDYKEKDNLQDGLIFYSFICRITKSVLRLWLTSNRNLLFCFFCSHM